MLLLTAVIEFALVLNAVLAVNFASREASLIAAEAGDAADADCLILAAVEASMNPPVDRDLIDNVKIYLANRSGTPTGTFSLYARTGSMDCPQPGGDPITVPYSPVSGSQSYPPSSRCNVLAGCLSLSRAYIDQIGVEVSYTYHSHTPIGGLFTVGGISPLTKGNVMRMEPVL